MTRKHPLTNDYLISYIKEIEEKHTIDEVIAWINIYLNIVIQANKNENEDNDENQKIINSLKLYKKELQAMLSKSQTLKYISVKEALRLLNINWEC